MNKFVIGALAITAASSLSYAGSETKEWSSLDRDIASLAQTPAGSSSGFTVGGFVRSRYAFSDDVDADTTTAGDQNLSGFTIDNARVVLDASQGDYGVHIALEAGQDSGSGSSTGSTPGVASLYEGYGTFRIAEGVSGQMGLFRAPFLWSIMIDNNHQILLDRTFSGEVWSVRQEGIQISGTFDQFAWWGAFQNGQDGVADDYSWTARGQFNALGTGVGMQEGAYGASEESSLTIGAAYTDDNFPKDGSAWAIDLGFTQGPFSAHGEIVNYGDDITPDNALNSNTGVLGWDGNLSSTNGDSPWSGTVGYMITPNEYEVAFRYQDFDDSDDSSAWTVGVNRYVAGHNAKWTLQYSSSDSDASTKEAKTIALGLTVGV
jgi:hypothetical protein